MIIADTAGCHFNDLLRPAQALKDGHQQEQPDIWLTNGNPWEIARPELTYKVGFYGSVDNFKWTPAEQACCALPSNCKVALLLQACWIQWINVVVLCGMM